MTSVDYLVIGAGACGLAFVDEVFHATDATFAIVDRRAAPGGHWNDAYPFVKLHQPATGYGLASRPLGSEAIDTDGFNGGLQTLASGVEVVNHYHTFLRDTLLPSGRVRFLPMTEHVGEGRCRSLLSGQTEQIDARVTVDTTLMQTNIPLTHTRRFSVADGVVCIPPNDLPRVAPHHQHYTVLGAGKTGLDAVLWLLAHGAPAERISWVIPRDPWMINRGAAQTGVEGFRRSVGPLFAAQMEAAANASSMEDLCLRLEAGGVWLRLDPNVWPTMNHCGTVTVTELAAARHVENIIRQGRVTAIDLDRLVLERGESPAAPNTLYVDCTASALEQLVDVAHPVFTLGYIGLQMIRLCQPTFSAALIGRIEATMTDLAEKQALSTAVPMPDTAEGWARHTVTSLTNQAAWNANPELLRWLGQCRLNVSGSWAQIPAEDTESRALLGRALRALPAALENLRRLGAA